MITLGTMSQEEKDLQPASTPEASARPKRVPVASVDGTHMSRPSDASTPGKRKRVRVTTSMVEASQSGLGTKRFGNRFPERSTGYKDEYPGYQQPRQPRHSDEGEQRSRSEFAERYQTQRAEGNFDYNYNRTERPQRQYNPDGPQPPRYNKPKQHGGGKPQKKGPKPKRLPLPPEPVKYKEILAPETEIRLNKFIANSGICSRREADALIQRGEVTVNGVVVTELGTRVHPVDIVEYAGKRVETESKVYVLLNKPKNCVTTSDDPECRLTVMDLVKNACPERIYPVGRLDRHTTGVLLITNDGDLASKLTHPSFMKKKIYHVWLDKPVAMEDMQRIADGIELEDGEIHADALSYVKDDDLSQVGIEIHSGRNRIVRRIFEHLGYKVIKLDRVYFAGLTKKNLPRGRWRYLNEQEVNNLRMGAFE